MRSPRPRFRDAVAALVRPGGRPARVQPVGFAPVTFDSSHAEPYGVGAFLLAASEVYRLVPR